MVAYDNQPFRNTSLLCSEDRLFPVRPHLRKYLVEPITNNYGDYIILTTKVRQLERKLYLEIKDKLFSTLNALSSKYKFMILGEKEIEYNAEYTHLGLDCVYSLYKDFIDNLPADRIIDLTIPKLGITAPNLSQFLNDCSLMANAKYTMTLGIGGNFSTAISIGNAVSYRKDTDHIANILYNDVPYLDALITQFPERFISKLESL